MFDTMRTREVRVINFKPIRVVVGSLLLAASATAQQAVIPSFDRRVEAPSSELEEAAWFGYTMEFGNLDDPALDALDDLLATAFQKNVSQLPNVGTAYAYSGGTAALAGHSSHSIVFPSVVEGNEEFGLLNVAIGDVRGFAADPDDMTDLAFIPAWNRTMDLSLCEDGRADAAVGAVDVFEFTQSTNPHVLTIRPTPEGTLGLPCDTRNFGHWVALADVDGDGYNDLIVGAPGSVGELSPPVRVGGVGCVYIYFGHEDFVTDPAPTEIGSGYLYRSMILRAPPNPEEGDGFAASGTFGWSVTGADLDGDGKAEVVVGRPEKGTGPGRAHVFHGQWLQNEIGHHQFMDVTPPAPEDIDSGVENAYETLIDNSPSPFEPMAAHPAAFGWLVDLRFGDLGQPGSQGFDGKPDLIVHSEGAVGYGFSDENLAVAGGLFVFFNDSSSTSTSLLDEAAPVKLMTPRIQDSQGQPLYHPQWGGRFGRSYGVVDWRDTNGDPMRLLLAGEPDRNLPVPPHSLAEKGGAVFAFALPLDPDFDPNDLQAPHINAWGNFVLLEPNESLPQGSDQDDLESSGSMAPASQSLFGGWITVGKYTTDYPGMQFAISSRERIVNGVAGAGRIYTFNLRPEDP